MVHFETTSTYFDDGLVTLTDFDISKGKNLTKDRRVAVSLSYREDNAAIQTVINVKPA